MIAAYSASQAGRDADGKQLWRILENRQYDGNQNSEGSPGGAGSESEEAGHQENYGRQEVRQAGSRVLHEPGNIFIGRLKGLSCLSG